MSEAAWRDLERVYAELDAELVKLGPVCRRSGACCRFARSGHELWTTSLEYEYLRARTGLAKASREQIERGTCPFLEGGRCGVREHRMLGCRVYFCDPRYEPHMAGVYEKFHTRVKDVLRRHGLPYSYFRFLDRVREDPAFTS